MQKKIELLSPAGNMESLHAAVAAGCDAVYLGGTTFSARAFAGNFDHEEMIEAVQYCHIHGVKVYVTMNTLLFEDEITNAMKEVAFLYENDVDALLVQDLGLFHWIRQVYPDFEIHCSTQMHIHNVDGAKFMKNQGAMRVVIARESSLETIREVASLGIDVEVFAYGAICISYSGQCLMSQAMKNRSGNRGMCAQMCRLKYYPKKDGQTLTNKDGEYLLSPRDLNVLDRLPELIEAGASSLKIEGRMKRPEYVYLVTSLYRKAIDAYYQGRHFKLSEQDHRDLLLMFNREFSYGHIFHASTKERMNPFRPNHMGITIGTVLRYENGRVLVKLSDTLYQHDGLRILNEPHDTGLTAVRIEKNGLLVNKAYKGDEVWLDCKSKPHPKKGQPLQKTTDTLLLSKIQEQIQQGPKKIHIDMLYKILPGQQMSLKVSDENGNVTTVNSENIVDKAKNAPLSHDKIFNAFAKTNDTDYVADNITGITDGAFVPVSQLNALRRDALDALDQVRSKFHQRREAGTYSIEVPQTQGLSADLYVQKGNELNLYVKGAGIVDPILTLPIASVVDEYGRTKYQDGMVYSQIGNLYHKQDQVIGGMNLNITNSYAVAFLLKETSVQSMILSSELNAFTIDRLITEFNHRYGFNPPIARLVYGKRTLMYIKNGISEKKWDALEDMHLNVYSFTYGKDVLELLEPVPVRQANENPLCGSYIIFTDENERVAQETINEAYEEILRRV